MILSMALILTGVAKFSHAKGNSNFESVPRPAPITDHPCIVFSGIAAMNLVLSLVLLLTSCFSSKVRLRIRFSVLEICASFLIKYSDSLVVI